MKLVASLPYVQFTHPTVGRLFEPMLDVTLSHGDTSIRHRIFVDSGADMSLIPDSLGLALGLNRETVPPTSVRGLVGRIGLRIFELHLRIGNTAPVPVRVGWADDENAPPLLGRLDVFDHFTFEFNHERRMLIVKH